MLETKRETVLDKGSFREVFPPTEADERIYRELEEEAEEFYMEYGG